MNKPETQSAEVVEVEQVSLAVHVEITVEHAVTAKFERNRSLEGSPFDPELGLPWDLCNETALKFVQKIEERFRKKNKLHGFFDPKIWHPMPVNLRLYLDKDIDFKELVDTTLVSLEKASNSADKGNLLGGNIVFVHYKNGSPDDLGRVLVVMVGHKSGFEFDKNLQPKSLSSIDVNALRQAAHFDLNLFDVGYPSNDGCEAYLRFIQGGSKSIFFQGALGCNQSISNKDSARNVIEAFRSFAKESQIVRSARDKIESQVEQLFIKRAGAKDNKTITLGEVQDVIDRNLPVGSSNIGKFSRFVNEREYQVSERFEPTPQTAKSLIQVEVRDSNRNYECKIKSTSIGKSGSNKPVVVDGDYSSIRIKLDADSQKMLKDLLGEYE